MKIIGSMWRRIHLIVGLIWSRKVFILGFLVGLYWVYYSYNHYEFTVFISYVALLVAAIAALATLLSLKQTRDMIRPFLSFGGTINLGGSHEEITLALPIKNTGSMPANDIEVIIHAFGTDEKIDIENVGIKYKGFFEEETEAYQQALVLFPNQTWQHVFNVNLTNEYNSQFWESLISGSIKLRITIWYRSFKRKHKTVQTLAFDELSLSSDKKHLHGISVNPQKWV